MSDPEGREGEGLGSLNPIFICVGDGKEALGRKQSSWGVQGGGRGSGEAAGRREADLGVSSFLTSIRAAGLGSLVARGAGLINNEFAAPPPAAYKVTPPSSQLPPLDILSKATPLLRSP